MYIYSVLAGLRPWVLAAFCVRGHERGLRELRSRSAWDLPARPGVGPGAGGGLCAHRECWYRVHIDHESVGVVFGWAFGFETNNDLSRVHVP